MPTPCTQANLASLAQHLITVPPEDAAYDDCISRCYELLDLGYEERAFQWYLLAGESPDTWRDFLALGGK